MKMSIGTPAGFSQSLQITGHWEAGAVKRALGCAASALLAGSHHVSVPFDVIVEMAENSLSQMAITEFDKNLSQAKGSK